MRTFKVTVKEEVGYNQINDSVTRQCYAPGIPDGHHECVLQWQYQLYSYAQEHEWENEDEAGHDYSVLQGIRTRRIWILAQPTDINAGQSIEKEASLAEEIAKKIFYMPATNGQSETSIKLGTHLIKAHVDQQTASLTSEIYNLKKILSDIMHCNACPTCANLATKALIQSK